MLKIVIFYIIYLHCNLNRIFWFFLIICFVFIHSSFHFSAIFRVFQSFPFSFSSRFSQDKTTSKNSSLSLIFLTPALYGLKFQCMGLKANFQSYCKIAECYLIRSGRIDWQWKSFFTTPLNIYRDSIWNVSTVNTTLLLIFVNKDYAMKKENFQNYI